METWVPPAPFGTGLSYKRYYYLLWNKQRHFMHCTCNVPYTYSLWNQNCGGRAAFLL